MVRKDAISSSVRVMTGVVILDRNCQGPSWALGEEVMLFYRKMRELVADKSGTTAIEYALIGSIVSIVIIVAVIQLGGELADVFQSVTDKVNGAMYGRQT